LGRKQLLGSGSFRPVAVVRLNVGERQFTTNIRTATTKSMPKMGAATAANLPAVHLERDLVGLGQEAVCHAEQGKLMIGCPRLRKAWLDDVNPQRDGTYPAQITDLGQAIFGANLKACWPTAFYTIRVPLKEMCKEVSPTFLVVKPHDAALSLPANDVHVVDASPRLVPACVLAVVEVYRDESGLGLAVEADADDVCGFACAVVIEYDLVPVLRLNVCDRSVLNRVWSTLLSLRLLGDVDTGPVEHLQAVSRVQLRRSAQLDMRVALQL